MNPTVRPSHPFKALVAFVAMAALVHGVFAHAGPRHANPSHFEIVTTTAHCSVNGVDRDCDDDDDPDMPDPVVVDVGPDEL